MGPFDLSGKVALVTGGNGGIGLGMGDALAAAGAAVCVWGTNDEKNRAAEAQLGEHGVEAAAIRCDVGDPDAVADAFAATLERFGRVDGCVANAGVIGFPARFDELPDDEWRRVLRVNLDGAMHTLRAAAGHMRARAGDGDPGGRLVTIASVAAISGAARNEHYAATKGALLAMTKGLAVEYARYGVTANAVLPGWIDTAMTAGVLDSPQFRERVLPRIPVRRWGVPADFGGIAVYLLSDASAYHTGDTLVVDGGYTVF